MNPPTKHRETRITASVVVAGLCLTTLATWLTARGVENARANDLTLAAVEARTRIERQVDAYGETLRALRSGFAVTPDLSRREFRDFVGLLAPQQRFPGALAITFNRSVRRSDVTAFEEKVRRDRSLSPEGYPDFRVHPVGQADDLFVIEYAEPREGSEAILGFDVGSTPERRATLEETRDTGIAVATPPLELVQGGRGFVLYLAVYDVPERPRTTPSRRRHLLGVVAAVFNAREMITAVNPRSDTQVEIYDVGLTVDPPRPVSADGLVFDQDPATAVIGTARPRGLHATLDLNVGSRRWRIIATPGPRLSPSVERYIPFGVATIGLILSVLLGLLVHSLLRSKERAEVLAERMTIDLRQRESDLAGANAHLEEANRSLRDFFAVSSHDMRVPLATISGSVEMLNTAGEGLPAEARSRLLGIVGRSAERLTRLVEDLLTASQIRAGALTVRAEEVDVRAEIDRVLDGMDDRVGSVGVTGPAVRIRCDMAHFQRIVTNLVENAFKYGDPPVTIEAGSTERMVHLVVSDCGPGVPEEFQPRLFERFARATGPTTAGRAGTGLGLSIVQGLAVANGGAARYETAPGGGASFVVLLPAAG